MAVGGINSYDRDYRPYSSLSTLLQPFVIGEGIENAKALILLVFFSERSGDETLLTQAVGTENRGVSRSDHRRLIRLPRNPGECANFCN